MAEARTLESRRLLDQLTYLKSGQAEYLDFVLEQYLQDPNSVDESWKNFFEGLQLGLAESTGTSASPAPQTTTAASTIADAAFELKVARLISTYRDQGKFAAHLDPLALKSPDSQFFSLSRFGLSDSDLNRSSAAGSLVGLGTVPLREIIQHLKQVYTGTLAIELSHMADGPAKDWWTQRIESRRPNGTLDRETQKFILKRLSETESFERFLHTRYVAQKRFSIEGGDSAIPALDAMIEMGAELGVKNFVIGMAHRGRLNVLTHILGKPYSQMFTEFEGTYKSDPELGEGDVKYHKGYSCDFQTRKGKTTHLSLTANPSHLEFVNPVVEGIARAKQDHLSDKDGLTAAPILIHGDAAFAGQGVCYETLNFMSLKGFSTGGTLHLIINNQVGFTSPPTDSRSTPFCTDLAKMLDSPIIHINGDDPETVFWICALAMEWRQVFHRDVFIDLVCYRKHGHNEGDEPSFTQPVMYQKIKNHPSTRELYLQKLLQAQSLSEAEASEIQAGIAARLEQAHKQVKLGPDEPSVSVFEGQWKGLKRPQEPDLFAPVETRVSKNTLLTLAQKLNQIPSSFQVHPKLNRFFEARLKSIEEGKGIDWGNGEALAFASLIAEGHRVRITGQDAERGTFGHRHSVLKDYTTGVSYSPFSAVAPASSAANCNYEVYNSHLSETAVLGFEYGYSLASPQSLVIWEAQFGDFANGAQVIIDQFITSSESKWQRMSGLVMLLPHGYEGQGPEHSSARLERFLSLCAKNNLQVANFTTPAQLFHALRRQVHRNFRKPLVIFSPKSMLRNPEAVSTLNDFTDGQFEEVIDCPQGALNPGSIRRIILCSGKVYYDLAQQRQITGCTDTAILRVEQLYPWPAERLKGLIQKYSQTQSIAWVQEEPRNMGAWPMVSNLWNGGFAEFGKEVGLRSIDYIGRDSAVAPAVGSPKLHEKELRKFLDAAFSNLELKSKAV